MKHTRTACTLAVMILAANFILPPRAFAEDFAKKLAGTKWSWPYGNPPDKAWFVLGAGGHLKVGWAKKEKKWKVLNDSRVELMDVRLELLKTDPTAKTILRFNKDLTQAEDERTHAIFKRLNPKEEAPAAIAVETPAPAAQPGASPTPAANAPGPTPVPAAPKTSETASSSTPAPKVARVAPSASPAVAPGDAAPKPLTAPELVKAYRDSLVFVTGKEGAGSGFIATLNGKNLLVTNAHVAAGINGASFKTLRGDEVRAGTPSVAVGHDIFCMAMPAGGKPLEIMQDVESNTTIGDDIVVLGNAEGQGVINTITGKIVGIGPNLVEISARIVPGNSGSPIIHLKTGKVIGVATFGYTSQYETTTKKVTVGNKNSKWTQVVTEPLIRRFGYRLDDVKTWQPVDWQAFHGQAGEMDEFTRGTRQLYGFFGELAENECRVTPGIPAIPMVKNVIARWLADNAPNAKPGDSVPVDGKFLTMLRAAMESDAATARQKLTYDYFQREFDQQKQYREQMTDAFIEDFRDSHN